MVTADDTVHLTLELNGRSIAAKTVGIVALRLEDLLQHVEEDVTGAPPHVEWRWEDDATVRVVASVNGASRDTLLEVVHTAQRGFQRANRGLAPEVNRRAQTALREILKHLGELDSITITAEDSEPIELLPGGSDLHLAVGSGHSEVSSIDGTLDLISVRRGSHFGITEHASRRRIKCSFETDLLEEVKAALGRRVVAEGVVRYRRDGTPVSIRISSLFVRPAPIPIRDLRGSMPGFTGGEEPEDYVHRLREDDAEEG